MSKAFKLSYDSERPSKNYNRPQVYSKNACLDFVYIAAKLLSCICVTSIDSATVR